jgi:CarD family transcriptional regulator
MQFAVGDKVVHPHHGPGWIAGVAQLELMDGPKSYYTIEIVGQDLTVHIPVLTAKEAGLRPAMSSSKLSKVLETLRSRPHRLPDDFKERQEQVGDKIALGEVLGLAQVVRDLTWHEHRAHLTKRDSDLLKDGWELLAAEMALVSGKDVSEVNELIRSTLASAMEELSEDPQELQAAPSPAD